MTTTPPPALNDHSASPAATIRLRPHHVLCAIGFEGKGYSDSFTQNMHAIVDGRLRAENGTETVIEITPQTDNICAPCPKRRGRLCTNEEKIAALDQRHAKALGLTAPSRLTWGEALSRARDVAPNDLDRLCAGCQWLPMGMCKSALARLRDE